MNGSAIWRGWKVEGATWPKITVATADWEGYAKTLELALKAKSEEIGLLKQQVEALKQTVATCLQPAPPPRTVGDVLCAAMRADCRVGLPLP